MEIQSARRLDNPSERKDRWSLNAPLDRKTLYAMDLLHGSNICLTCVLSEVFFIHPV